MTRRRLGVATELAGLALIVGAAAAVYLRSLHSALNYDEGNYLASLDALRHGQVLGRDVFLDQPPGWYLLLQTIAAVGGEGYVHVRLGLMALALVGIVAAWSAARTLLGPAGALGAAGLLAITPSFSTFAATVEADPASTVLALVAVAVALRAERRGWVAGAAGVVFAAAVSVKLFAVVALLPLVAILLRRGGVRALAWAAAGGAAVVAAIVLAYRDVLHEIWKGVFGAHLNAVGGQQATSESNPSRLLHVVDLHTPFGCLAVAGLVLALLWLLRGRPLGLWPLWLGTLAAAAFTLTMRPLLDHHLVLFATALAVPAGAAVSASLARLRVWAPLVLVLVFGAGLYQEHHRLARDAHAPRADVSWATRYIAAHTRPDQLVVSDIPSIPYLADRRQPGQLIDTSIARIVDEYLPPADVLRLIDRSGAAFVVVGRTFNSHQEILRGLAQRYPRRIRRGTLTIYTR